MSTIEFVPESPASFGGVQGLLARVLDVTLIVVCARLATSLHAIDSVSQGVEGAFALFACAFTLAVFPVFGVYQSWRGRSILRLVSQVVLAWMVVAVCALVMMFAVHRADAVSRLWFTWWIGYTAAAMVGVRLVVRAALSRARHAGMNLRNVAIVGCGEHCQHIVERIQHAPATGFRAMAAFDAKPAGGAQIIGVPAFSGAGHFVSFVDFVRRNGIQEVWLALPLCEEQTILQCVNAFRDDLVNVRFIPDVRSMALFGSAMIDLIGMPAMNLVASPMPAHALAKKELFDRVFAAAALLALLPVFIAVSIAVKLSSRGPVFFTQKRMGADGRVFRIYKFRTMRQHAEVAGQVMQATRNDSRITKVGGSRPAPARDRARRTLSQGRQRLYPSLSHQAWHHGLGAGERLSRRDRSRGEDGAPRRARSLLPAPLVVCARHAHRGGHRSQGDRAQQRVLIALSWCGDRRVVGAVVDIASVPGSSIVVLGFLSTLGKNDRVHPDAGRFHRCRRPARVPKSTWRDARANVSPGAS